MEAVKELDMKLKYVNRLRGLNRNHPDLQAAVDSCVEECKIVLAALNPAGVPADSAENMAEDLTAQDVTAASQQGVLDELRRAFELQKLLALNADTWPAVQRQGWRRVLYFICSLFAGTGLIELATAAGFPPFQGWVRVTLVVSCYAMLYAAFGGIRNVIRLATAADTPPWTGLTYEAIGVVFAAISVVLIMFIRDYFDSDRPARLRAVAALQASRDDASSLQQLPSALPAHASLREALHAFAGRYLAALQRDQQRADATLATPAWIPPWWRGNQEQ